MISIFNSKKIIYSKNITINNDFYEQLRSITKKFDNIRVWSGGGLKIGNYYYIQMVTPKRISPMKKNKLLDIKDDVAYFIDEDGMDTAIKYGASVYKILQSKFIEISNINEDFKTEDIGIRINSSGEIIYNIR